MAGPANGILGSTSLPPTEVPVTDNPDDGRAELKRAAAFAKSKEFAELKEIIELKINKWKVYLPGESGEVLAGDAVKMSQLQNEERGWRWLAADAVINELQGLLNAYEQAAELLNDESTK